jgi:hypothetical protein
MIRLKSFGSSWNDKVQLLPLFFSLMGSMTGSFKLKRRHWPKRRWPCHGFRSPSTGELWRIVALTVSDLGMGQYL